MMNNSMGMMNRSSVMMNRSSAMMNRSSAMMNHSSVMMNRSSVMTTNGSQKYQTPMSSAMMYSMSKNGSKSIHSMPQSQMMMSSMSLQMQPCSCGPASHKPQWPQSSMYHHSSIKPSHAMSSKMMKSSSSIIMEKLDKNETAINETAINSPSGFVFKKAVAIQSLNFKFGKIGIKTSSKALWSTLASASLAQSVIIQSGGAIR